MRECISLLLIGLATTALAAAADDSKPFIIQVIDDQTGRGVPLVELRTVANQQFWTDSNGLVAFNEPGLMNQAVYFHVQSDGYEFPADGFGYRGRALQVVPGGSATLKLKRLNIAERLYRITGQGIYRDTVMAGRPSPIRQPLLDAKVVGQDSVQAIPYRNRIYWFWGDTARPAYPLGNFGSAGATSKLPGAGKGTEAGLDPSIGIDFDYFTDKAGFSRAMCNVPGPGPKWIDGLMLVKDESGRQRLVAKFERMKDLGHALERGLLIYDDAAEVFQPLAQFDLGAPLYPGGQPFRHRDAGGVDYFYFPVPFPTVRVRAELKSLMDPGAYEAFTCLATGARYSRREPPPKLDRKPDGSLNWSWKRDTARVGPMQERELIAAGRIKPADARFLLRDPRTNHVVVAQGGSVCYNDFRHRWIMIALETGGDNSFLGEVWYAEADAPTGPWRGARKILTHHRYSFYNPVQHPFFDQQGGRVIYFEGTYASTFAGNDHPTPLYDYNQIMYRLDLADPRLVMPAAP